MNHLAVIGAGMAGLAAAHRLRASRPDIPVTLYEQSRELGGRVATRRHAAFAADHGAQYLKAETPELLGLIQADLPADELFDIAKPVWVFDRVGTIAEGDPAQNADPKWSYRSGLHRLAELLADGLDVRHEAKVAALRRAATSRQPGRWVIADDRGQALGEADAVLLTPPAPQTAALVAASDLPEGRRSTIAAALAPAVYRPCLSVALGYQRIIHRPFYALVNTDRAHQVVWLALEHDKGPQRCPPGHSLIIAQLAPTFSGIHWEASLERLALMVTRLAGDLLGEDLDEPVWVDRQAWQYALPIAQASPDALAAPDLGLFFAGDYTAGQGRVHLAIEQGWRAADQIAAQL